MSTIRWSPITAHLMNNAPGTIVVGSPGSGKTFAMLVFAANCLGMGQRIIAIDPKNDFSKLYNVNKNIEIIDINKIRPGALNPMEFLKKVNIDGSVENIDVPTLLNIIELLVGRDTVTPEIKMALVPIITDFVTMYKKSGSYVDMTEVAEYLYGNKNKDARIVGNQLKIFEDSQYGPLLFTKQSYVEPLVLSPTSSMVISLHGMDLPEYTKKVEDYGPNERFTSAILYILTKKLLDILSADSKIPTVLFCDEAHLLFANKEMSAIIDKFLVLGRSLNVATVLASQGISHFPKGISNYITTKFIFKSSIEEAELFIDTFDTSKIDPANAINVNQIISDITRFQTGTCFMMDRKGRNGIVYIHSIYDAQLLTSNPFEKEREEGVS